MTLPQYHVLNLLASRSDECTPFELARAFQVTKGAMTNTLKKLERRGFISVNDDPTDGRRKLIRITRPGREVCTTSTERLLPVAETISRRFPDDVLHAATPVLRDVRGYLDENRVLPGAPRDG